jgi:hypothetical protein
MCALTSSSMSDPNANVPNPTIVTVYSDPTSMVVLHEVDEFFPVAQAVLVKTRSSEPTPFFTLVGEDADSTGSLLCAHRR